MADNEETKQPDSYQKVMDDLLGVGAAAKFKEAVLGKLEAAAQQLEEEKKQIEVAKKRDEEMHSFQLRAVEATEQQARAFGRIALAAEAIADHFRDYVEFYRQFGGKS